jgi:hypothetical protein
MKAELLDSAPPGSTAARDRAGWFQKEGVYAMDQSFFPFFFFF